MTSELSNLWLFFCAIAKVLVMTGVAPAIAIALFYSQVSGRAVSHNRNGLIPADSNREGNQPARNVATRRAA